MNTRIGFRSDDALGAVAGVELHELSFEELDAVSGGSPRDQQDVEDKKQARALETFQQLLQEI